ncbi:MAG: hypothetical protein Q8897_01405 [Sweet potato little leaf phytoplasma]|uniref:Uncharacterized protein n=2 Tax=16SrII (Peanut WB group) TaxID=85621 RepID=A0A9K3WSY8_9MOLU|nr:MULTISPECIES: hypothetical protein [Phytoplasma]MCG3566684.1 hypothetical protein [Sesame phyllody phytoplasma]MDO7987265.1 hypothetical protein [Sweet potato little leaf phytoplasma]MDO8005425.1 hypothetical protein [Sweet potato little leaf phytoplasma]MDO8008717.1 hypothetical protein [Sweet potato little leaf phytoplasma]MDO8020432.1 hypothetical protein [Sweet potato little leaf phytoplasma]
MLNKKWDIFRKYLIDSKFWKQSWFIILIYSVNFLGFLLIISWKLNNRTVYQYNQINFSNVFDLHKIYQFQINDRQELEETIIFLKSMFLGIINGICFMSLRRGLLGITLGTFIGAFLGLSVGMIYPSIIYFLELIYKGVFKV